MKLTKLHLRNFRNHSDTRIESVQGANVFLGKNGEGKTNIVEALAYLCLTKSFYAANDLTTLKIGEPSFKISGEIVSDRKTSFAIEVVYENLSVDKKYTLNKSSVQKLSSVIGQFPVVVLSPEYNGITFGPPSDRRKFLDLTLSQASKRYLEDLLEFRRILKQRNRILFDARKSGRDCEQLLEPWTEGIIEYGVLVTMRRMQFIRDFGPYLMSAYKEIAVNQENPSVEYLALSGSNAGMDQNSLRKVFAAEYRDRHLEEIRTGSTIVGPHRDELDLRINWLELRKYGSQGQHKTFLIALKIAEFHYLKDFCGETPILILDDVFSELDPERSGYLLESISHLGQYFITTTEERIFPDQFFTKAENRKYYVRKGSVEHEQAAA